VKIYKLGLVVIASLAFGLAANAELKTMVVTGTVDAIDVEIASGPFSIGDPMTAVITYDDAAPDEDPSQDGYYPVISYGFTVGDYSGSDNGRNIAVVDDFGGAEGRDEFRLTAFEPFVTGPDVAGLPLRVFVALGRGPVDIFPDDALPESLDVADWTFDDGPSFSLGFLGDESIPRVFGSVDSITISPAAGTIFVSGDLTPGFYVNDEDNGQFFTNILQDGTSVVVQSMSVLSSDEILDTFYDGLPGVVSSLIDAPIANSLTGADLFISVLPETAYSATDIAAMQDFLLEGGSIAFLGEFTPISANAYEANNARINAALAGLGSPLRILSVGFDGSGPSIPIATGSQIADDPFTAGVASFKYGSTAEVAGGTPILFTKTGEPFFAYEVIGDVDSDGDGIPDADDNCPDLKQPVDFSGPEPVLLDPDSDGDGFGDMCDECPQEDTLQIGPCLPNEIDTFVRVGSISTTGPILVEWSIDFGEEVTVYKPSCGKTVTFEGLPESVACDADPALPECQVLGVIHRQTAQVTPDDLFTGQDFTLVCDLRNHLIGLDPDPIVVLALADGMKTTSVVANFTSEGHTEFNFEDRIRMIKQITITSPEVLITRDPPPATPIGQVSCSVAPDPWYTIYGDTSVTGPPVEITLGIPLADLSVPPDPILVNGVLCDDSGLENPVVSTNGSTTFLCERTSAFNALGTVVAGDTAKFLVEGTDKDGNSFEASDGNLCTVGIADPVEIVVDLPNSINLDSKGVTPVCLVSQPGFDATTVIPLTVTVASSTVKVKGNGDALASVEDCGGDSRLDLKVKVVTDAMTVVAGEVVEVRGETTDGISFVGQDTINIVPVE